MAMPASGGCTAAVLVVWLSCCCRSCCKRSYFGRLLNLVAHDLFPLGADQLVEPQGCHGVFRGRMCTGLDLPVQFFVTQFAQTARPQDTVIVAVTHLHEGFVLGRVARLLPGVLNLQGVQIIFEGVSDENLVPEQGLHLLATGL